MSGARDCDADVSLGIAVVVMRWSSVPNKSSTLMHKNKKSSLLGVCSLILGGSAPRSLRGERQGAGARPTKGQSAILTKIVATFYF